MEKRTTQEKTVEEWRAEERRAKEKRAESLEEELETEEERTEEEKRTEEKRAEEKRAEEKRAEEGHEDAEEEWEAEEWAAWEAEEGRRLPLAVRLCVVAAAAAAVGLAVLAVAAWAFAVAEGPLPLAVHDAAVRAEHAEAGLATVLWEAAACGTATHYRVLRHNPLLAAWRELPASPTAALAVRDAALPAAGGGAALVHYRIVAEDGVGRRRGAARALAFRIAGPGAGGAGAVFWAATSDRAPAPPCGLGLADVSREEGARELLLQWEAAPQLAYEHGPGPLGYAVFVWSFASGRWEEVERFEGFRRRLHYGVRGAGRHCFVVKAQAWGAVGWSAPSRPLCIFVAAWAYAPAAHAVVTAFPSAGAAAPVLLGRPPPSATAAAASAAAAPPVEHWAYVAAEAFADAAQPMARV